MLPFNLVAAQRLTQTKAGFLSNTNKHERSRSKK